MELLSLPSPGLKPSSSSLSSSSQAFLSSPSFRASLTSPAFIKPPASLHGFPRHHCVPVTATTAQSGGQDLSSSDSSASLNSPELSSLDRRQLLLGSTSLGIAGLPSLLLPHNALSTGTLELPDLKKCTPIDPGNAAPIIKCCLPVPPDPSNVPAYQLPTNLPVRTRVACHQASAAYIEKYKRAYQLLRELPDEDPRSYTAQYQVHCAFCAGAYNQQGYEIPYQVHFSWLFFPWHRWYLYFHERILATLLKDDTFALPFWNWDAPAGSTMPALFLSDTKSPLYNANRNASHMPPSVVNLNYGFEESGLYSTAEEQLAANKTFMYQQMVSNAKTPTAFFGKQVSPGDVSGGLASAGTIENAPHIPVHAWTGNPNSPNNEDMGDLYSAARDAMFFAHHANIDRLWVVWKTLGGRRADFTDEDYLNTNFIFYDENAQLVKVKIQDCLDPSKLFYKYDRVPNLWLQAGGPKARSSASAKEIRAKLKKLRPGLKEFKARPSKVVGEKPINVTVKRPKKVRADDFEEEILVLEGVELAAYERAKFDVYINLAVDASGDYSKVGYDVPEFAGSFYNLPHTGKKNAEVSIRKSDFRLSIGEVLKAVAAEDEDEFELTIVPRVKTSKPITVTSVKIEYE